MSLLPSRTEAETILATACTKNLSPWSGPLADHCRVVARFAETVAKECGLDIHRVYVSGLLHDIGRYESARGISHVFAGYSLMKEKKHDLVAKICLSHSFPYQNIGAYGGAYDCTPEEMDVISTFLSEAIFDDYDKLIQLGDAMAKPEGICLIDVRQLDVVRRHGFDDFTLRKWDAIFSLKKHFDELCNMNIYDLFYDEIRDVSFR